MHPEFPGGNRCSQERLTESQLQSCQARIGVFAAEPVCFLDPHSFPKVGTGLPFSWTLAPFQHRSSSDAPYSVDNDGALKSTRWF